MSSMQHSSRLRIWLLNFFLCIFVCGLVVWGIREVLFPPSDVCAIEQAEGEKRFDINQIYPLKESMELVGHVGGEAKSIFVRGEIAFVKLGLELAAFDIRNPLRFQRIGYVLIPGELIYVDEKAHYAYINASGDASGLWRVDVADPTRMSAVHLYHSKYNITSIRLFDEQAYINTRKCEYTYFLEGSIRTRCDDTLHLFDMNNPDSPTKCYRGLIGKAIQFSVPSSAPELIVPPRTAQEGTYLYAAEEKDGLKVYDISNPIQRTEVGSYPSTSEFIDVSVYGNHGLVTSLECKEQGVNYCLHVFDVGNPTNPMDLDEVPYKPIIIAEFNHYAAIREQFGYGNWPPGVDIFDMSLPISEVKVFTPPQIADIVNMVVINHRAYATTSDNMFVILDMSNVEKPLVLTSYRLGAPDQLNYAVAVVDKYAYIIVRDQGMRILDIADESNIREVGSYAMDTIPVALTAKGHYAYIAEWYGTLEIVNVSNPVQPIRVHVYDAGDRINGMHIVDNYLFMTASNSGLQVMDISDPTAPDVVGSFITGTFVTGVDIDCPYIYVSDIENGLFVLKTDLISTESCHDE